MNRIKITVFLLAFLFIPFGAIAENEKKFVFPHDVKIVEAPALTLDYNQWKYHKIHTCQLPGRRNLESKVFARKIIEGEQSTQERFYVFTLDKKDFAYFEYSVVGQWQDIFGLLYISANGQWGEFRIHDPMNLMRAQSLLRFVSKSLDIKDVDLDKCKK